MSSQARAVKVQPKPEFANRLPLGSLDPAQFGNGATNRPQPKPEPTNRPAQIPPRMTPSAVARLPGMGVIDMTKDEPIAKSPPATQWHSIIVTAPQKSLLFKLPESVRNTIYRFAFVSKVPIKIQRRPFPGEPNLLFTCKEIRKEAQLMFWTENSFQGRDAVQVCKSRARPAQVLYQRQLSLLLEWLCRVGFEKAHLIKKLQVDYDEDCQFNGHPAYTGNWPATPEDVMKHKKLDLAAAARYSAIKILRGLVFHGVRLEAVKPVPILKGMVRGGQGDTFGLLWKLAMEEVIDFLGMPATGAGTVNQFAAMRDDGDDFIMKEVINLMKAPR